jgi:predicted MPP superfamily phosphohydrolase
VDLQISGHTHGGHVIGMDRWMVAPVNNGFVRGLYRVDGMQLFVSSGAGLWIGFPIRLGVPSAIEVLVLRAPGAARS